MVGVALLVVAPALAQPKLETCAPCHGPSAISTRPLTPSLASQPAFYVKAQLVLFRTGQRKNEVMQFVASQLSNEELQALADAVEKFPPPPPPGDEPDGARVKRGRALAQREHCESCHQPDYSGIQNTPRLAHQREDYLLKALTDFKQGSRVGSGEPIMPGVASALSEAEIGDLAHYLAHFRQRP